MDTMIERLPFCLADKEKQTSAKEHTILSTKTIRIGDTHKAGVVFPHKYSNHGIILTIRE